MRSLNFHGKFTRMIPPGAAVKIERKEFLNRKRHPFYKHGDAALFLARKTARSLAESWQVTIRITMECTNRM